MPDAGCPMKAMRFTRGWRTKASPVSRAPVTMLTTPGGRIALQISPKMDAESGLCSDGFTTMVLPEMIAGTLRHGERGPGGLSLFGRFDGCGHIRGRTHGYAAQSGFIGRVDGFEPGAVLAFDELATDQHAAG